MKKIEQQWREYTRWQRQNHMTQCSLAEFTRYVRGQGGLGSPAPRGEFRPAPTPHDDRMAAHRAIPSHNMDVAATCSRRESPRYTGTYVKGIAQTHKSNAVPVVDDDHMKDIARMRR